MKKRLIAIFLCLLMLFALLPAAIADGDPEEPAAEEPAAEEPTAEEPEEPAAEEPEAPASEEPSAVADEPEEDPDAVILDPEDDIEASDVILINEDNFPDANFRKWIVANVPGVKVDSEGVCSIKKEDAKKVTSMDVSSQEISTLSGVGKFSNIETLICSKNKLKNLDVNKLKQLKHLACDSNVLEKITLGSTKLLETLDCRGNEKLKTISLKYNVGLKKLLCNNCAFTTLDVSPCTNLEYLRCSQNQIKTLDISKNEKLAVLICEKNPMEKIDVSKNAALIELRLCYDPITEIDVSKNPNLQILECAFCKLKTIDVSKNGALLYLNVNDNQLTALNVTANTKLNTLNCESNSLKTLDLSKNGELVSLSVCSNQFTSFDLTNNPKLQTAWFYSNQITSIDLSKSEQLLVLDLSNNKLSSINLTKCTKLEYLDVGCNELPTLSLNYNLNLKELYCQDNQMTELELSMLTHLEKTELNGQHRLAPSGIIYIGGDYKFDMNTVLSAFSRVEMAVYPFNKMNGYVTLPGYVSSFDYYYDTGHGKMLVTLMLPYSGTSTIKYGTPVQYKDKTPYVVYNGKEQKPNFTLLDADGNVINPILYTYTFAENTKPGTGYINVTFKNTLVTAQFWFKIYLPPTKSTTVENVQEGIKITWEPVEGAAGYVIYRRAWSSTTGGWTNFARWWNVTGTTWTDGTDSSHQVYACTRYQYGVKAYFAKRYDPVAGVNIGGNENIPLGNYNLGLVGPMKTTVRITTRVLEEAKGYTGKIFVKWIPSKYFTGYEIQYARNSAFTQGVKTIKIDKASTYGKTIDNMPAHVTYYFRVRSYHEFEGFTYYGQWSNVKSASAD